MNIQERRTRVRNYGPVEQPHLEQLSAKKCCKIRYRVRYFCSKSAYLVLLWTLLTSIAGTDYFFNLIYSLSAKLEGSSFYYSAPFVIILPLICIPLIGWFADGKFGNYKLFRAGSILFFLSVTTESIILTEVNLQLYGYVAVRLISGSFAFVGTGCSIVTALQLGLDQMPDASSANITSFISWFVCSLFTGAWISDTLLRAVYNCAREQEEISKDVHSLLPSVCMALVCCSIFICAQNYLVVEPKSPKSLKNIYKVLKFAAKHKAPLNRSAFTYWEEDIPSRMDLGKSKYGGPFTTEQVEDVKTFLKILVLHVPIFIIFLSLCADLDALNESEFQQLLKDKCSSKLLTTFTSNRWWSVLLTTVIYEFGIYPLVRNKVPNTLTRIGIAAFLLLIIKSLYMAESVAKFYTDQRNTSSTSMFLSPDQVVAWTKMPLSYLKGSVIMFVANGVSEFVCAQSPYNMRGVLIGLTAFLVVWSSMLSIGLQYMIQHFINNYTAIICYSCATALSLVGFILHCGLARWYKRRVRDEVYSPQRVVEEIYDRYLSHVP